jgi:hypothetical protein
MTDTVHNLSPAIVINHEKSVFQGGNPVIDTMPIG